MEQLPVGFQLGQFLAIKEHPGHSLTTFRIILGDQFIQFPRQFQCALRKDQFCIRTDTNTIGHKVQQHRQQHCGACKAEQRQSRDEPFDPDLFFQSG